MMMMSKQLEILYGGVERVGHSPPGRKFGENRRLGRWDWSEGMLKKCQSMSERVGPLKMIIGASAHETQCGMELCKHM